MKKWMEKIVAMSIYISLVGCHGSSQEDITGFIPGVYVHPIQDEFGSGSDTMEIQEPLPGESQLYSILKVLNYQPAPNNRNARPVHKVQRWMAEYKTDDQVLEVVNTRQVIGFYPALRQARLNGVLYEKVN